MHKALSTTCNAETTTEDQTVLAAILTNSSDGMLVLNETGHISRANSAAEKQFAAAPGQLHGLTINLLFGAEATKIAAGQTNQKIPEFSGNAFDGRRFPVDVSITSLNESGNRIQLWIIRDVSERIRAQRDNAESGMRFQDFAEASSDCFWEMDQTHTNVEISSSVESELAKRLPECLISSLNIDQPLDVSESGWRTLQQSLQIRQRFRVRISFKNDNGEFLHAAIAGKPIFDSDNQFRGYRGTARDVTREIVARESAHLAERRLTEAMDASPCAVALVDQDLRLVSGNSALRELAFSNSENLPFGHSLCEFLTGSLNATNFSPEFVRHLARSGETREIAIGSNWYLVAAGKQSDGGIVLTFSDITTLKEREREIAEAKQSAESANRLKSQFLATMSHELRTPLNAILGFSEVIRDGVFGHTAASFDKYAEYAGSIHTSGRHLLSLISEILDLSKIEAGNYVLDIRPVDLREVLEGALTIISPSATKSSVEIQSALPGDPVWICADERAIRQIAINLLANAVKFTPPGGTVMVEIRADEFKAGFSIRDTGIGIAKEHTDTVFEAFRQVDSSIRRRHEGTGLGLAITKRLVELHDGTIRLESEVAVGTNIHVDLPRRMNAMPSSQPIRKNA